MGYSIPRQGAGAAASRIAASIAGDADGVPAQAHVAGDAHGVPARSAARCASEHVRGAMGGRTRVVDSSEHARGATSGRTRV